MLFGFAIVVSPLKHQRAHFRTSILFLTLLAISATAGEPELAKDFHEQIVSDTACDISGDGIPERIQVVLISGKKYVDKNKWCGSGEKWEGQFVVRVRTSKDLLLNETPLNIMLYPESKKPVDLFFWTPMFKLVMQDYNHDGKMDFNLGQYGSCVGNDYTLFSISADGAVIVLPIDQEGAENRSWFVSPGFSDDIGGDRRDNSTEAIKLSGKFVVFAYFNRMPDRHGVIVEKWEWTDGRFQRVRSDRIKDL